MQHQRKQSGAVNSGDLALQFKSLTREFKPPGNIGRIIVAVCATDYFCAT